MQLIPIEKHGFVSPSVPNPPDIVRDVIASTIALYERQGYEPPWIGYLAVEDDSCVGTCAFTSAPTQGQVEIAYFTFPPNEGRGVATRMAQLLIGLAAATDASVLVKAHTLSEENASTTVLRRLGFEFAGVVEHPTDGTIWEWRHRPLG